MKIVKVTLAILVGLLFLFAAAAASNAQYVTPQYGSGGSAGNSAIYGVGSSGPLASNMPSGTTTSSAPNMPALSSPYQAANLPAAGQYGNAAASVPAALPYGAAYGTPYAGPYGGPVGAGLTPCAAPLAAPLAAPCVAPLAAVGPYSAGFTYAKQMSSAYGPFTPPVSQASEQYYQYPGVTPYGVYPGAGYAATGGVGYDPLSGYYGPYGAYTPL